MTIFAITGHRPEQLDDIEWVREALANVFKEENPETIYQGMAAGVDMLSAMVAHDLSIPYIAARPWAGHAPRVADKELYNWVLKHAKEVIEVDPDYDYAGVWVYHNRNKYMVDKSDKLIAVWNGRLEGGTAACVKYAKQKHKEIIQINPITKEIIYPQSPALF